MFEVIYRYDPARRLERKPPADAAEACRRLEDGNRAFAGFGTGSPDGSHVVYCDLEDLGVAADGGVPKQRPFAVVLGCADARVPIELIFDRACNELFVVRVAGNILGQEQLGSIDYAVENLGRNLKLVAVLGHSQCGAVTAAVNAFLQPEEYLGLLASHHIRAIVNDILPAVRGAAGVLAARWGEDVVRRPGYRAALTQCAVVLNAALTASILREEFADPAQDRRFVFGVYDLGTRRVQVPLAGPDGTGCDVCLADAPADREAFAELDRQVAGSPLIRRLLGT
jgi:carbonic anhydrase